MLNKNINRLVKFIKDLDPISVFMVIVAISVVWYALSHSIDEKPKKDDDMRGWKKPSQGDTTAVQIQENPARLTIE